MFWETRKYKESPPSCLAQTVWSWDWWRSVQMKSIKSLGTATVQKRNPEASGQLPTADNVQARDIPMPPELIRAPRMFDVPHPNSSLPTRPATITLEWVLKAFPDVPTGLGQFGRLVTFDLDPKVTPVHDAIHRQPVAWHAKIKEQLHKMESEGKICRQYEPTDWCSNMTVRETKDTFRICLDPSNTINKAIRLPKHPIPHFEDILPQLNGAKCFSVADAMSGFTNILLDHESSLATTFHTSFGRYRWLRLPYGVSSGPEEYHAQTCRPTCRSALFGYAQFPGKILPKIEWRGQAFKRIDPQRCPLSVDWHTWQSFCWV